MCGITGILDQQKPAQAEGFNEISYLLTALYYNRPTHHRYKTPFSAASLARPA
jgi:hypothetical protein